MQPSQPTPELLLEHADFVRRLAERLTSDPHDADDLVQETWIRALTHRPRHVRNLRGWLGRVVSSRWRSDARARGRRADHEGRAAGPETEAPTPSPAERASQEELLRSVTEAVLALPEIYRRTLLDRYHGGLEPATIAQRDGISTATVRSRTARGLELLAAGLTRRFGSRETWAPALALWAAERGKPAAATLVSAGVLLRVLAVTAAVALVVTGATLRFAERPEGLRGVEATVSELRVPDGERAAESRTALAADLAPPERMAETRTSVGEPVARTTRLEFLESNGEPLAGTRVVRVEHNGVEELATDGNGRLSLRATGETAELVVERPSAAPYRFEAELEAGDRTVRLPAGAVLSGRMLVDGSPPGRRVPLQIYPYAGPEGSTFWNREDHPEILTGSCPISFGFAEPDGRFRFHGLPDDWRGRLRVPHRYVKVAVHGGVMATEDTFFFLEPKTGVEIRLEHAECIHGRVVDPRGLPVPEVQIHLTVGSGETAFSLTPRFSDVEEDGSFHLPLPETAWASLRDEAETMTEGTAWKPRAWVRLWRGPGVRDETHLELDVPEDRDLGDLVLETGRELRLLVVDAEGLAIEGAGTQLGPERSDQRGRLVIAGIGPSTASVRVFRGGYLPRTLTLHRGAPGDLRVELEQRTNVLRVSFVDPDGLPVPRLPFELSTVGELFLDHRAWVEESEFHDGNVSSTTIGAGRNAAQGRTNEQGVVSLGGLHGSHLRVRAFSDDGVTLADRELPPLRPEESRSLEIVVPRRLRSFGGIVLDEEGEPIHQCEVRISVPPDNERQFGRRATRQNGRFLFPLVAEVRGSLRLAAEGYLPLEIASYAYDASRPHEFRLVRGRRVLVLVREPDGAPVDGGHVRILDEDVDVEPEALGLGRFELPGLPDRVVEVALELAGARYVQRHDPREPELVFDVPAHGTLEVELGTDPRFAGAQSLELRREGSDEVKPLRSSVPEVGPCRFAPVLPGRYVLVPAERGEEPDLDAAWPVEVQPRETVHVRIP